MYRTLKIQKEGSKRMNTLDIAMILTSVVFLVLIIQLNFRLLAKEALFITSTVLACSILITQFFLVFVLSIEILKALTHWISLILNSGIVIFQIYKNFSNRKYKNKSQKKFLRR